MLNFSDEPYYDDFDETKHFHKILFKPGVAVQSRELTQMQSIIQAQIDRFGSHIFKEGSVVHGGEHSQIKSWTIAIKSFVGTTDITFFIGKKIFVGDIIKLVLHATTIGSDYALYVTDITGGDIVENSTISVKDYDNYSLLVKSNSEQLAYKKSTLHSIKSGIFFAYGIFVKVEEQVIIASTDSHNESYNVHLVAYDSIVTYNDDESLLDNSYGTPNYAAPGADRYTVDLKLEISQPNVNIANTYKSFLLASYRNGELIGNVNKPQYSDLEIMLANRTYQESGNYTVDPFIGTIQENTDNTKVTFKLDAGTAYVDGFEISKQVPTNLEIDKARTTAFINNGQVEIDKGPYILIENVTGYISPYTLVTIDIHNVVSPSTSEPSYSNTKIGTATAFGMLYDSINTGPTNTYKLFITDLKLAENSIKNARSFVIRSSISSTPYTFSFYAQYSTESYDTVDILGNIVTDVYVLNSQSYNQLFRLVNTPIKTHINSITNNTDLSYQYYKEFTATTFTRTGASSIATITLNGTQFFIGSGVLSSNTVATNWYAKVRSIGAGSGTAPTVGNIIKLESGSVNVVSDTSAIITIPYNYNLSLDLIVVIGDSTSSIRSKVLHSNSTITISDKEKIKSSHISLLKADGISLISVIDNLGNDHASKYIFSTGQLDNYYDHCSISLKNPDNNPLKEYPDITSIVITFDYYSHTGTGPIVVDSYSNVISYDEIQSYRTSNNEIIRLSDVMDFRPRRTDNSTVTNPIIFDSYNKPHFGSFLSTDYEYYLPRIDRIYLSGTSREILIEKGIPSKFPRIPEVKNGMTLYLLTIPAYTFKANDVISEYVDNKRYTMKDIAKIDTRVSRLEYYASLSLLEKQASDEMIPSSVPGIDKFKNGILVDSFAGHSVGDVFNPYYICSVDLKERYLRPSFISNSFDYILDTANSSNINVGKDLITLTYSEIPVISQTQASEYESVQPFSIFKWNGIVELDPPADIWNDTISKQLATVNLNGEFDHLVQGAQGDVWSDWQTTGVGITDLTLKTKVDVKSGVTIN